MSNGLLKHLLRTFSPWGKFVSPRVITQVRARTKGSMVSLTWLSLLKSNGILWRARKLNIRNNYTARRKMGLSGFFAPLPLLHQIAQLLRAAMTNVVLETLTRGKSRVVNFYRITILVTCFAYITFINVVDRAEFPCLTRSHLR